MDGKYCTCVGSSSVAQVTSSARACCKGGANWGGQLISLSLIIRPVSGSLHSCNPDAFIVCKREEADSTVNGGLRIQFLWQIDSEPQNKHMRGVFPEEFHSAGHLQVTFSRRDAAFQQTIWIDTHRSQLTDSRLAFVLSDLQCLRRYALISFKLWRAS